MLIFQKVSIEIHATAAYEGVNMKNEFCQISGPLLNLLPPPMHSYVQKPYQRTKNGTYKTGSTVMIWSRCLDQHGAHLHFYEYSIHKVKRPIRNCNYGLLLQPKGDTSCMSVKFLVFFPVFDQSHTAIPVISPAIINNPPSLGPWLPERIQEFICYTDQ